EYFQKGRLAGTIPADDADHLATFDFKIHTLEGPKLLGGIACKDGSAAQHVRSRTGEVPHAAADHVAQSRVALAHRLVADQVLLAEPLGSDDDVGTHVRVDPRNGARYVGSERRQPIGRRR